MMVFEKLFGSVELHRDKFRQFVNSLSLIAEFGRLHNKVEYRATRMQAGG